MLGFAQRGREQTEVGEAPDMRDPAGRERERERALAGRPAGLGCPRSEQAAGPGEGRERARES